MRLLKIIFVVLVMLVCPEISGRAANDVESHEEINVGEILFGHIGDSYGWHITQWNTSAMYCQKQYGLACLHVFED